MLEVKNISVALGDFALRNLFLSVAEGEYVVVLGMSGVGKTVLLEMLAGLTKPQEGQILLNGEDITNQKIQKRPIRLVYQDQALFPHLCVKKNLAYGLLSQRTDKRRIEATIAEIAAQLGIEHLLDRMPETLSGGEAQRVALGRALVTRPELLLLDEPLSALDPHSRGKLQVLLRELHRRQQTIIHVTHDYEEAISLATRIILLENGSIAQQGPPQEIFTRPESRFVAKFMGIRNVIAGELTAASERSKETALFQKNGTSVEIMTEKMSGPGFCVIRSEDITLADHENQTSALNQFKGTIVEMIPSAAGVEVVVDTGIRFSVMITATSVSRLDLKIGKTVYISFKATATHFIPRD